MEDIIICILESFVGVIVIVGLLYFTVIHTEQITYHYEYIDVDNNKGTASECSYKFEGYKKGGQGSPVCVLEDGTVIQVKQYKQIITKRCIPAEDKECEIG